jgi:hypothetical protein
MKLQRSIMTGVALAVALAPVVAQAEQAASPASKLSLSQSPALASHVKRAGAPVSQTSELTSSGTALVVFGVIAAGILVWLVTKSDNPDSP